MKILVTGGAGFIGSHLCDRLIKEEHSVVCVDNFLTGTEKNIAHLLDHPRFQLIKHDVIEPLSYSKKIDALFHLASPASPNHHSKISYHALPMETMLVNTTGTLRLIQMAKKNEAKFLFASTSEVYGDPKEHPQREDYYGNVSPTGPRSIYDEAKRFGETIASYFFRSQSVDIRIVRIFNTYGPRMLKEDMRMIIAFIHQSLDGSAITIFGKGNQTRSLCYIDDIVEGLLKCMFAPNTKGEIVNLGSQEEHTVLEYAQKVKKLTQSQSPITYHEVMPKDDPQRRRPDISKAKKLLHWQPTVPLEEGLKKMIEYFKKEQL